MVFTLQNCKDEPLCKDPTNPKCPNYDPCFGKKPVTADFEIGISGDPLMENEATTIFEPDTIFARTTIIFKAKLKNAKYKWILGSEKIYDSTFYRTFGNVPYGRYKVTLIVEKEPDLICFPKDDGKDTLTRYFHIVPRCQLQTTGSYKGVWEGQQDSFIFKILYLGGKHTPYRWDTCTNGIFAIINGKNSNFIEDTAGMFSRDFILGNYFGRFIRTGVSVDYDALYGEFKINPLTRKLRFEYTYNAGEKHVIFNGRKL